ncbi:hypothetical protein INH39_21285 [Massilia violaceinigra]|uniref:Uncharacterized protein n=1 Tax=Massilia violaceinigra TaxID=2045208 RepID=A0ABY4A056_9BURK|nr:hypothetical protein [Massilia violaceinigra]UOD28002.1 hypothetical protein INH39_21285 [Massilia violaceinigra]
MISQDDWDETFSGFNIYDCAIHYKGAYAFLCIEQVDGIVEWEPNKLIVSIFFDDDVIELAEHEGFAFPTLAATGMPVAQAIMVSASGEVAVLDSDQDALEANIPFGTPESALYRSADSLALIDGHLYATGNWRGVARRLGKGCWESIAGRDTLPLPDADANGFNRGGFRAIDGFNARDIYCGGGKGDVWRFDGTRWHQCALRVDLSVVSICCAGDGFVYVGMQSGSVMRGREDTWEMIYTGTLALPFKDLVWFAGKVWCTSDHGLWVIERGILTAADVAEFVRAASGNLAVGDGVMLLAGMYGAALFDGVTWNALRPAGADPLGHG